MSAASTRSSFFFLPLLCSFSAFLYVFSLRRCPVFLDTRRVARDMDSVCGHATWMRRGIPARYTPRLRASAMKRERKREYGKEQVPSVEDAIDFTIGLRFRARSPRFSYDFHRPCSRAPPSLFAMICERRNWKRQRNANSESSAGRARLESARAFNHDRDRADRAWARIYFNVSKEEYIP